MKAMWVEDDQTLGQVISEILQLDRYALDTEFHREKTYFPQLALIQLKWGAKIALVDPLSVRLRLFAPLFASDMLCVVHAAQQDLEVLNHACGIAPTRIFDTQVAAGFIGMSSPSLLSLVQSLCNVLLTKGDRLTDWLRRPLTADQRTYAASDVEYLLDLHDLLSAKLEKLGRSEWVRDACEELRVKPAGPTTPHDAWLKIKEVRTLKAGTRGVAQSVADWRERKAMAANIPPRRVLSDMALLGIAQAQPQSTDELFKARGIEQRQIGNEVAKEILRAVSEGVGRDVKFPASEQEDVDKELRPAVGLITAWIGELARTHQIDATLLGTRHDILHILRKSPQARLAQGWRADIVGKDIESILAGSLGISFDGHGGLRLVATNVPELS
jgi:ribonuclease D